MDIDSQGVVGEEPPRSGKIKEVIPLNEYPDRGDGLRKMHAQSSAETSGLGDSLQRIHTLSSTETSGYGEAISSPTAPVPSPERYNPRVGRYASERDKGPGFTHGSNARRSSVELEMIDYSDKTLTSSHTRAPAKNENESLETSFYDYCTNSTAGARYKTMGANADNAHSCESYWNMAEEDPSAVRGRTDRQTHHDYITQSRRSSYKDTDIFLGKNTKSTWLKWSQDRRESFKKKLDGLEQRQRETERGRVSTPVRKARKESVMFVSPELEGQHFEEDAELCEWRSQMIDYVPVTNIPSRRRQDDIKEVVKLTVNQWNNLLAFWEHEIFVISRFVGISLGCVALILGIVCITHQEWLRFNDHISHGYTSLWFWCPSYYQKAANCSGLAICSHTQSQQEFPLNCTTKTEKGYNSGIWKSCQYNVTENKTTEICPPDSPNWQKAVIGLMIFSVAFGFLATVLSICGACTGTLPKKIYYFHSAGEIYFICALSSTAALIVYPVAVEMENALVPHFYGSGYKIGWGASGFFFAAALCMCLDDLVRTITKGLCKCCCKSSNSRV